MVLGGGGGGSSGSAAVRGSTSHLGLGTSGGRALSVLGEVCGLSLLSLHPPPSPRASSQGRSGMRKGWVAGSSPRTYIHSTQLEIARHYSHSPVSRGHLFAVDDQSTMTAASTVRALSNDSRYTHHLDHLTAVAVLASASSHGRLARAPTGPDASSSHLDPQPAGPPTSTLWFLLRPSLSPLHQRENYCKPDPQALQ